jgi:Do/DeqQ family serine protease
MGAAIDSINGNYSNDFLAEMVHCAPLLLIIHRQGLAVPMFRIPRLLFAFTMILSLLLPIQGEAARKVPASAGEIKLSYAPLVSRAAPGVVNIYTKKVVSTRRVSPLFSDPFFKRFFGNSLGLSTPRKKVQNSLGSGVIVGSDGLIVTNYHVIEGADQITVVLSDRREFEAKLVRTDKPTDLAVLKIDPGEEKLSFLALSDSDELVVGDLVLAIGNPFGVGQTVTSGIVSALARTQIGDTDFASFIQTDAAINPGNSGGALIGMDGRLIGINTAIFSKSGGSQGIGFAIPSNMVRSVLAGTAKGGRLVRAWFGAWGQTVTADIADGLGMERPTGVVINKVYENGPADAAGLKLGDVVMLIDGFQVNDPKGLNYRIATLSIGAKAELKVLRRGREMTLMLSLAPPPEDPPRNVTSLGGDHPFSDVVFVDMSPALADELGLSDFESGVYILRLDRRTYAARAGFRPNDRIISVNGISLEGVETLKRVMSRQVERWEISIKRGDKVLKHAVDR